MALTHYLIVRRDLPLGVMCAQLAHAAGESFFQLGLSAVPPVNIERTTVVVLGARNEHRLKRLEAKLQQVHIPHAAIREPDAPWDGQLMAIGLVPGDREQLSPLFRDYQILSSLDPSPWNWCICGHHEHLHATGRCDICPGCAEFIEEQSA